MKTIPLFRWITLLLVILAISCEKKDHSPEEEPKLEIPENFIGFIEEALSYSSGGMLYELEEGINLAGKLLTAPTSNQFCGLEKDTAFTRSLENDFGIIKNDLEYSWGVSCDSTGIPVSVDFNTLAHPKSEDPNTFFYRAIGYWTFQENIEEGTFQFFCDYKRYKSFTDRENLVDYTYTLSVWFDLMSIDADCSKFQSGQKRIIFRVNRKSFFQSHDYDHRYDITFLENRKALLQRPNGVIYELDLN